MTSLRAPSRFQTANFGLARNGGVCLVICVCFQWQRFWDMLILETVEIGPAAGEPDINKAS